MRGGSEVEVEVFGGGATAESHAFDGANTQREIRSSKSGKIHT